MFEGGRDCLGKYEAHKKNDPIKFIVNPETSNLWKKMGVNAYNFENYNITYNSHSWSIGPLTFENNKALGEFYRPLSTAKDIYGKTYISSMEAYKYPFYGV